MLSLVSLAAGGCIEVPEFDPVAPPNNLGSELDEPAENCSPGELDCACKPDGTCDPGLSCNAEDLCTVGGDGDGDGDPTTGDGDGDPTTGDGDGDPTTGDGDGDLGCLDDSECPNGHLCDVDQGVGQCVLQANLAFVTAEEYPANFGGLAVADGFCQEAAQQAGLDGTFVALLTDSTVPDASIRLAGVTGWVRTDFRNLGNDPGAMIWGGELYYPLNLDQFGEPVGPTARVYTGGVEGSDHCDDWTSSDPFTNAYLGYASDGGPQWFNWTFFSCADVTARFYCFQIDHQWQGTPPLPASYRRAFLSQGWVDGAVGAFALDAMCQQEAQDAGLADGGANFRAFIARPLLQPINNFDLDLSAWVRVDGATFAEPGDLFDPGTWLAPLNVHANGEYGAGPAWAGSFGPAVAGTAQTTCNDWSTNDPMSFANVGYPSRADEMFSGDVYPCDWTLPVYCLEE